MSTAVFPTLPGLAWNVMKTPVFNTSTYLAASGKEVRASYQAYPRWRFTLTYEFLRADAAHLEFQQLIGFYLARRGDFDNFFFTDPSDCRVVGQAIGTGNGVQQTFQFVRTLGGFTEPLEAIAYPTGWGGIMLDGVQQLGGAFSVLDFNSGIMTFITPPPPGSLITWTGNYYWRCRFLRGEVEYNQFLKDLWEAKKVELITDPL